MTLTEKLSAALAYLQSRGKHVLQLKQTRERWARQQDKEPEKAPLASRIRRVK